MPNTREKLIELLCNSLCFGYDDVTGSDYVMLNKTADRLISNGVTVQKWIPVTERLPDKDGKYLTYYHNHFGDITRVLDFAKDARKVNKYDFHQSWKKVWYEYDSECGYFTIDDVTHWMPLPEPPKGETE